jgi:hypothetical protein
MEIYFKPVKGPVVMETCMRQVSPFWSRLLEDQ